MEERSWNTKIEGLLQFIAITTGIIALALIIGAFYVLRRIFAIFAVSFFLAYIISPLINFLERHNVNRGLAIFIISILILGMIGSTIFLVVNRVTAQIQNLTASIPEIMSKLDAKMAGLSEWLTERFPQLAERVDFDTVSDLITKLKLAEKITPMLQTMLQAIVSSMGSFISVISMAVIVPFLSLFMLISGRGFRKRLVDMVPNRYFEPLLVLMYEIDKQLGSYLRGRALETLALSALAVLGLALLRVRFYGLLGVLTGMMNLIPYIGPVLGAIPACIMILVDPNFKLIILILAIIFFFVLQFIDNMILFPLIVGKSMDLGPITTVFVLLVSAKIFGFLGLIIAIPAAATLKVTFEVVRTELRGA
jgi:predicted PurR-regulated permease PerM